MIPILDHMVFNVRYDMDAAEAQFTALGFHLTPRGYHTLGSINHLMILGSDYLELIGLPQGGEGRAELAAAPVGLNGLVFKSANVDHTYAHLKQLGWDGEPPKAFSRPVAVAGTTPGTQVETAARFRTVAVRADVFPAGRVYFCEHGTPELVWRDEWRGHANSCSATRAFIMVAEDVAGEAAKYSALLDLPVEHAGAGQCHIDLNAAVLEIISPGIYAERFNGIGQHPLGPQCRFAALALKVSDRPALEGVLAKRGSGVQVLDTGGTVIVWLKTFNALFELQ
ncbi:MAG: VOC family protein [Gammaproteobacteria bacterium]|nr:VOC family protein [Gammaproteobacteria bacterium]